MGALPTLAFDLKADPLVVMPSGTGTSLAELSLASHCVPRVQFYQEVLSGQPA